MSKIKFFRIFALIFLVLWMILIFVLSNENSSDSSSTSGDFSRALFNTFYPEFNEMTIDEQAFLLDSSSFVIRKLAHFSIYAILGILSFLFFITFKRMRLTSRFACSVVFCLLYSVTDEIHQSFIPGRSCELRDIMIDTGGALTSVLIIAFIMFLSVKISIKFNSFYNEYIK